MSTVSTGHDDTVSGVQMKDRPSTEASTAPVIAAGPKLRRRPLLLVLAVALVAAGSALGVLLWSSASTSAFLAVLTAIR